MDNFRIETAALMNGSMEILLKNQRRYNADELLNPKLIALFNVFSMFMFITDILCEICYCKLVLYCTSKEMKSFRNLTLLYIFATISCEICLFLWKPVAILPFKVIYPIGVLSPMSAKASLCCLLVTVFFMSMMLETLLLILFEKYFVILVFYQPKFKAYRLPIYGIIYGIYILFAIIVVWLAFQIIPDEKEAQQILQSNLVNAGELLSKQSSLLMAPKWSPYFIAALIIFTGYAGSRMLAGIWLIYANYKYIRLSSPTWSKRTHKQMSLIFRSTVAQLFVNFLLGFFPCIFWFISTLLSFGNESGILLFLICFSLTLTYPIVDFITVIIIIGPYKKVVLTLFHEILSLHRLPNQIFPATTIFVTNIRKSPILYYNNNKQ